MHLDTYYPETGRSSAGERPDSRAAPMPVTLNCTALRPVRSGALHGVVSYERVRISYGAVIIRLSLEPGPRCGEDVRTKRPNFLRRICRFLRYALQLGSALRKARKGCLLDKALVGLADAIEALREELMKTVTGRGDELMRFALEPIELTVQVVITKDVNGRIGWSVVGVGGGYEKASTQSVTLRLAPFWRKQDGTLTSDFTIASVGMPDDSTGREAD